MKIKVLDIIKSDLATNISGGVALFDTLKNYKPSEITASFIGIKRISSLFLNESIGRYAIENPGTIQELKFEFPEGKELFSYKVEDVIENALMGDDYDALVENALQSY